jgi:hypothetical protein
MRSHGDEIREQPAVERHQAARVRAEEVPLHRLRVREGDRMKYEDLKDAIDGLHAYDTGCIDSGIKDELLRERVKKHLQSLPALEHRLLVSRLVIDMCLSEEMVKAGYGPEDAKNFLVWLDEEMNCLLSHNP